MRVTFLRLLSASALLLSLTMTPASADTIRVGVAVSLKEAMTDIVAAYEKRTGDKVELSFGSSGQIMAQIKGGAAIDAFISAADKQVDELARQGLVDPATRRVIAGNTLVLIVPRDSTTAVDTFESLATAAIKRVAIGEPKTVPAGEYAAQVLKKLKLSDALKDKLVYGANVRQVLDYVARGEVTAGIVYATDAKQAAEKVKVVATAPKDSHEPIAYPAVLVEKSRNTAAAGRFLDLLGSEEARLLLERRGFTRPAAEKRSEPAGRRP
jgi:molybdate transport system substrate-binding protein